MMTKDPVCGMMVNPQRSISFHYKGQTYHFCSQVCKRVFEHEPEKYALIESQTSTTETQTEKTDDSHP